MTSKRARKQRRKQINASIWLQLPLILWLVLLWIMLWDHLTVVSVLSGFILAFGVTRLLFLPAVELGGRFNLLWFTWFAGCFFYAMCRAAIHVSWLVIRPRATPSSSVIAVALHTRSDLLITLVAQVTTLIPGSLVVEVNRPESVLYLHVLGAATDAAIENQRAAVHRNEERLVRALGSKADIIAINSFRTAQGKKPLLQRPFSVFTPGREDEK